jgi:UDP-N-acetylglucosamine--N-acetylmuramyl-(pentapeptide) pyrophosphoryl-undecaprenol N-acetylglucosamine transferase
VLHEQNAVLGRANRLLCRLADRLALGMADTARVPRRARTVVTGNPVRPAIAALAGQPYHPPEPDGPINLLVTGGSQGARVFSDALPRAVGQLSRALRARLRITQQCRPEDLDRVRQAYATLGVPAELSAFFPDMAERLAAAHFVVGRAGASTVAELAVAGRPALLVPLPGAIDDHQTYNAIALGRVLLEQGQMENEPMALAEALGQRIACPETLAMHAIAMTAHAIPDAAQRLADMVEQVAALQTPSQGITT